ncbi:MAG: DUF1643 domain-containing protein [Actinomycetaceae bacterium]|nr:DUF1643 domain-containing protein [Actinomycetaceae bacterium]
MRQFDFSDEIDLWRDTRDTVLAAWRDEAVHVYPQTPTRGGPRWFLRTGHEPNRTGQRVLFIGMNPSSATAFATRPHGGDPTIEAILELLDTPKFDLVGEYQRLCIVNLVPIINSRSKDVGNAWNSMTHNAELCDLNLEVCRWAIEWADVIIPMWGGSMNKSEFTWKKEPSETIERLIRKYDKSAFAFKNRDNTPTHCAYGNWNRRQLVAFPFH